MLQRIGVYPLFCSHFNRPLFAVYSLPYITLRCVQCTAATGERVGSVGWIPVKCVSASPVQLAQLECKLLLDQHDSQATEVLLLRTQISQLKRALADVEDKHASELMAARSRSKRSADDRVSEERIRCAKQIDDFSAQLDFAKAETQTVRAEMKAAVDSLQAEIKAIKEKNKDDMQSQRNEADALAATVKESSLTALRAKVGAKEFELTEMYEGTSFCIWHHISAAALCMSFCVLTIW